MPTLARGEVAEVMVQRADLVRVLVRAGDEMIPAVGFPRMLGAVAAGDEVVVNTTGIRLGLGTGGVGFLVCNLDGPGPLFGPGHIVKLRYTPQQTEVLAAEEPDSPHHSVLREQVSISGMPVVCCGLHSQVAGAAAGIKAAAPEARVGYLMSDGGALPLAWSELVGRLRARGLIDVTCTYGHAFGGDLEAVNVFSGLAALMSAGHADVVIAALGPGVVGTGTALGFSAIEQGQMLDAASALGGRGVACLRLSFAESRSRHVGVSHHTLTALGLAARDRCTVAVPVLVPPRDRTVRDQLHEAGVSRRHDLVWADGEAGVSLLRREGIEPTSMGRRVEDVPELFVAASAAGCAAARLSASGVVPTAPPTPGGREGAGESHPS